MASQAPVAGAVSAAETPTAAIPVSSNTLQASSPVSVTPVAAVANPSPTLVSGSPVVPVSQSDAMSASGVQLPVVSVTPLPAVASGGSTVSVTAVNANTTVMYGHLLLFFCLIFSDSITVLKITASLSILTSEGAWKVQRLKLQMELLLRTLRYDSFIAC